MSKRFEIHLEVETNYNQAELSQVLEKVLDIPSAEYSDCDSFDYKVIQIKKIRT